MLEGATCDAGVLENGNPSVWVDIGNIETESAALVERLKVLSEYIGTVIGSTQADRMLVEEASRIVDAQLNIDSPQANAAKEAVGLQLKSLDRGVAASAKLQESINDGVQIFQGALEAFAPMRSALDHALKEAHDVRDDGLLAVENIAKAQPKLP